MAQEWYDLYVWEQFFDSYPIKTMLELGTGHGGMTLFLALQCYQRGIGFHTYDNVSSFNFGNPLAKVLEIEKNFHNVDIFGAGADHISQMLAEAPRPLAIFFDDGDKPKEWRIFAPKTVPGDFCIVHDWGTEFKEEDTGGVAVSKIMVKECEVRTPGRWKAMWFQRT
jgi:cephalosporin hydroxylase